MSDYSAAESEGADYQENNAPSIDQCHERSRENNRPASSDEYPTYNGAVRGIAAA